MASGLRLQSVFPLPEARHLPGLNGRPEEGPVLAAAAVARQTFDPEAWSGSAAYLYGFDLLAGGFFWEAHEVWEPAWMRCWPNSLQRKVLQGLIQGVNAGLKGAIERPKAAQRLLHLAAVCFEEVGAGQLVLGVEPGRAAAALRRLAHKGEGAKIDRMISGCSALQPYCIIMHKSEVITDI